MRRSGLEPAPAIGPNRDGLPIEGDIVQLEAGDFPEAAAGQEEERHQYVRVGGVINRRGRGLLPTKDPPDHHVGNAVGTASCLL